MPPFQYPEIHPSPFAGSIADILLRKGDIAAHAAESIGAAWGGAIQNIGQNIGGAVQRANDPKIQTEALNLQEQKKAIADHDTFRSILKSTPPIDENGMKLYDLPTMAKKATDAGIDPSAYLEHYGNVNTSFRNEYQARMGTVQAGARGLMLTPDPVLAKDFIDRLQQNQLVAARFSPRWARAGSAAPLPSSARWAHDASRPGRPAGSRRVD